MLREGIGVSTPQTPALPPHCLRQGHRTEGDAALHIGALAPSSFLYQPVPPYGWVCAVIPEGLRALGQGGFADPARNGTRAQL